MNGSPSARDYRRLALGFHPKFTITAYETIMANTEPFHQVDLVEHHCETHSVVRGFWNVETIQTYFDDVNEIATPLVKARSPIYALVDFTDFVPQDRATGDAIRDHLMTAQKFGLKRIAILGATTLTKMQYKRLSEGLTVEFFETKADALNWLRADR